MKLSIDSIDVVKLDHLAGIFIGKSNTIKKFHHEKKINEVIGAISGNENKLHNCQWIKTKEKEG